MTTVQLETAIRREADKNDRKLATLDAKLAAALVVGHWKDAEKFKRKIADEADRHAEKAAKLQAKLNAAANALDEDVPAKATKGPKGPEKVGVKDWLTNHWWLVFAAIPGIIVLNALKGCMGLNN